MLRAWFAALLLCQPPAPAFAAGWKSAQTELQREIASSHLQVSFSALHLESARELSVNAQNRQEMASVYKLPIALVLLKKVEEGALKLTAKVPITKSDLRLEGPAPVARQFPQGGGELSLGELLKYMVSYSDNTASDLILKALGGPAAVTKVLRAWGFSEISVDRFEKDLNAEANAPGPGLHDTASARALTRLYEKLWAQDLINAEHARELIGLMTDARTPDHIKNGLPEGTDVFHKSGWCAKDKCLNDTGLVTLPRGRGHLAIAVLIAGDIQDTDKASKLIGRLSRLAYDAFTQLSQEEITREKH